MNDAKYIGLDVHQATITATVLDSTGKLLMESILETKAETILQFVRGLRGSLHVIFEEGTCAVWLQDLLKAHVAKVLVCDPRKNALLKVGNKHDRIDSRKLAELLRSDLLRSVFHENTGLRTLKELARGFQHKGWTAGRISPLPPVVGEVFLLTSPFIERAYRGSGIGPNLNVRKRVPGVGGAGGPGLPLF